MVLALGWEDPIEEGVATHSSILAWKIPATEDTEGAGCQELDSAEQLSSSSRNSNLSTVLNTVGMKTKISFYHNRNDDSIT